MILVLGATGFIGSRLAELLLREGFRVRAGGRSLERLVRLPYSHHSRFEAVAMDVMDRDSLLNACEGVDIVVYLVHSMGGGTNDFSSRDREAARNMTWAAAKAEVGRIIYLSGLGDVKTTLSKHLKSRHEVGKILASGPVPVTVLRAAMVIGNGSGSYEILRYLIERLPVMITPRWVRTRVQPIAVGDVLRYILGCAREPATAGQTFDIGGPDVVDYQWLMWCYVLEAGLRWRLIIPVPVFTPRLSSYWIHLVTPIQSSLAVPLAEGLSNEVICLEQRIQELVPMRLTTCREAIARTLDWRQFFAGGESEWEWVALNDPYWAGGKVFRDVRVRETRGEAAILWQNIGDIGGRGGIFHSSLLWRLRAGLNRLLGGEKTFWGWTDQRLDFWEKVATEPGEWLLLKALLKVPGRAFLEYRFEGIAGAPGRTMIRQQVVFIPRGLLGLLYWTLMKPVHAVIFPALLKRFVKKISSSLGRESGR